MTVEYKLILNKDRRFLHQKLENCSEECIQLVCKLLDFDKNYPNSLEPEMLDQLDIVAFGKEKHPDPPEGARANWLLPDGSTVSHNDMHDRMFHHLSRSFSDPFGVDKEFPRDHLLFLICRATMMYIRRTRSIKHPNDPKRLTITPLSVFLDDSNCISIDEAIEKNKRHYKGDE